MIFFLAPKNVVFCLENYILRNRQQFGEMVSSISYDQILDRGEFPAGSYIFAALDQVTATERVLIGRAYDELSAKFPQATLLNDPRRIRLRYDLLQAAHEIGGNQFRVHRATLTPRRTRFPAFVRSEHEHTGSLTPLLYSSAQISTWVARLLAGGHRLKDLLAVEYLDTASPDGCFRKYSAHRVKDRIVPRALVVNRDWVTKDDGRLFTSEAIREDYEFTVENPHRDWLREIFDLSGITYGRIDYGMLNGRPQVWEINTNPTVGASLRANPEQYNPARDGLTPARNIFRERFHAAMVAADYLGDPGQAVRVPVSDRERQLLRKERAKSQQIAERKTWISRTVGPPIRFLRSFQTPAPRTAPSNGTRTPADL